MELVTRKGDFKNLGVKIRGKAATFTFELENGKDPALLFFEKNKKDPHVLHIPKDYIYGRVCSVTVSGIPFESTGYLLSEDGCSKMDPYAPICLGREKWNDLGRKKNDFRVLGGFSLNMGSWEEESRPDFSSDQIIMYRLHLRGFTMDAGLNEKKAGNYLGLIQRLSYLKELGVNTLEFQPLYDFEEVMYKEHLKIGKDNKKVLFKDPIGKVNYWGYTDAQFFAPKASYFGEHDQDIHMKEMVKAIHRHGMEIVMEMSFDPDLSDDFIVNCLKHWAFNYHIDGFHLIGMAMPVERIANDPFLGNIKIFYDQFPEAMLREEGSMYRHLFVYDSRFTYPLRRLINHKDGSIIEFANMMKRQNEKYGFVNYAASAGGFTLRDSFSYIEKHNKENGEDNVDGNNFSFTDNVGVEGDTNSRLVWNIRLKNIRTSLGAAILSQGIPMIQSGDEVLNSQLGNNNAYCQDNKTGWVNFSRRKRERDLRLYVKKLIEFRKAHDVLSSIRPKEMRDYGHKGLPDLSYHGSEPWTIWLSEDRKALGILYAGAYGKDPNQEDVMLLFNFFLNDTDFALPKLLNDRKWYMVTNTTCDTWQEKETILENQDMILVPGGSLTILIGKEEDSKDDKAK